MQAAKDGCLDPFGEWHRLQPGGECLIRKPPKLARGAAQLRVHQLKLRPQAVLQHRLHIQAGLQRPKQTPLGEHRVHLVDENGVGGRLGALGDDLATGLDHNAAKPFLADFLHRARRPGCLDETEIEISLGAAERLQHRLG